jgi:hypothetical protein
VRFVDSDIFQMRSKAALLLSYQPNLELRGAGQFV